MAAQDFSHLVHEPAQATRWPRTLDPADYTPARAVQRVVNAEGICVKASSSPAPKGNARLSCGKSSAECESRVLALKGPLRRNLKYQSIKRLRTQTTG